MIVSVVLDTEYMGPYERKKWFLKMVSEAQKTDMLIITHEYMRNNLEKIIDECSERFYEEFEMSHIPATVVENMAICYMPDSLFDDLYNRCRTRSRMLIELTNNDNKEMKEYVLNFIKNELRKRDVKKVDYIMNCLHVFKFIKNIAAQFECPIIPYVFSAIRKVHGYEQTLYMAHVDDKLFNSESAKTMYLSWDDSKLGFPVFTRKEILALLGKTHNMFLFPLLNAKPVFDLGIIGEGFKIIPEIYQEYPSTDDDIFYEAKSIFKNGRIIERLHPIQLDQAGIGRKHMKNDPASFVLSCNKVATVQSQMILKAILWNRVAITKSNALPFSFLLEDSLESDKIISDSELNYIFFGYLVPDCCMFDDDYWKWRLAGQSATAIARKHIGSILHQLGIAESALESKNRLLEILQARNFNDEDIAVIESEEIVLHDYKFPISILYGYTCTEKYTYYTLNKCAGPNEYISVFHISRKCERIEVCLQNDVDGFICLRDIKINGKKCVNEISFENTYLKKGETTVIIDVKEEFSFPYFVQIEWRGIYYNENT